MISSVILNDGKNLKADMLILDAGKRPGLNTDQSLDIIQKTEI